MAVAQYRNVRAYQPTGSRYVGIGFVVALHIVLVWALVYVLGKRTFDLMPQDVQVSNIEQPKPKEDQPPPPPPKLEQPPPPFVPPPEVNISTPAPTATTAIQTATTQLPRAPAPVAPPPPPPAPKAEIKPAIDRAHLVDTDQFYPAISKRLGEQGSVIVQVEVAQNGSVVDARVARSSNYARLDAAAVDYSRRALHFMPFQNDKPVWTEYQVRFVLR